MGVKYLTWLLKENYEISPKMEFMNSKLVVDGSSLVYQLYVKANLDQNHGGEYLAFQVQVQDFFKALSNCGINPYVVMDGGSGINNIKVNTIMDRARAKVWRCTKAAETGSKENTLPALTWFVFKQTLRNMNVPLAQCFGRADCELAALASEWSCPVLSNDSDFYIYDLPGGFLLLDCFKWDQVMTGQGQSYILCQQYTTTHFCNHYKILRQLLPVFASLCRNDYIASAGINWGQNDPPRRQEGTSRLEWLLGWLGNFKTQEESMTELMKLMSKMPQEEQTNMRKAMLEYQLPTSSLLPFFTKGTVPPLPAEMLRIVPDWLCAPQIRGDQSGFILDMLVHHRNKLQTLVEHSDQKSSNLISTSIREVLYGLLLGQGGGFVEELDREGLDVFSVRVTPELGEAAQTLRLDSLAQADQAVRLQVCLETLGVDETTLEGIPAHLRLPVAVTSYWQRRAQPLPRLLRALLMVMVQGELNRQGALTTGWQGDTNHIVQPLDPGLAQCFNQWQACLTDASKLNQLLGTPLPQPHFAWLFQGRLVHQKVWELKEGTLEVHREDFLIENRSLLEAVLHETTEPEELAGLTPS